MMTGTMRPSSATAGMSSEMWPLRMGRSPNRSFRILATCSFGTSGSGPDRAEDPGGRNLAQQQLVCAQQPMPARATARRNERRLDGSSAEA